MACCLEVVLFSYSSQRTFPWIINIFKLASFYFFKVSYMSKSFFLHSFTFSKLGDLHHNCEFAGDRGVYPLRGRLVEGHGEAFEPDWGASSREPSMEHGFSPVECPAGCWQQGSHCGGGKRIWLTENQDQTDAQLSRVGWDFKRKPL